MTPQPVESLFRRILVAIDASDGGKSALDAVALLAARQEAELLGLFVEDTDLLNLAALPFAREVGLSSVPRPMDPTITEHEIRAQAAVVERRLATLARDVGLSWSFEIRRGRYESEVLAVLAKADLLVLSQVREEDVAKRIALLARVLSTEAPPSILLIGPGSATGRSGPVAVRYDASPAAESALTVAARFAGEAGETILVLLDAQEAAALQEQESRALSHLKSMGLTGSVRHLPRPTAEAMARTVRAERVRLLAMGIPDRPSQARLEAELACASRTSILLTRGSSEREGRRRPPG